MQTSDTKIYYDEFSRVYDRRVGDPYHTMIDDMEVDLLERYSRQKKVLECGCGTGLILERVAKFASEARGIDLSTGMVEKAGERGLNVKLGSVTDIPFPDDSFDVVYSFKVLPHVPDIKAAIKEMTRVVSPQGYVIAEFYNPTSIRELIRKLRPGIKAGKGFNDKQVFYRADRPNTAMQYFPENTEIITERGIRIVTVFPGALKIPVLSNAIRWIEYSLMDRFPKLGGFYIIVSKKL